MYFGRHIFDIAFRRFDKEKLFRKNPLAQFLTKLSYLKV